MKPQYSKRARKRAKPKPFFRNRQMRIFKKRREDILRLRSQGLSYKKIEKALGCSRSTISYHCGKERSEKLRVKNQKKDPLCKKVGTFKARCTKSSWRNFRSKIKCFKRRDSYSNRHRVKVLNPYTCEDVVNKLGERPRCYLTGKAINLKKPESYSLDHIVPVSKGGTNELDNMQITCAEANAAKSNLTLNEFHALCRKVLEWKNQKKMKRRR